MLTAVLVAFGAALAAPFVHRALGDGAARVLALVPAALFAYFATFVPAVAAGGRVAESTPWVPSLGVELAFWLDGLSLTFALLITGLGALIVLYAGEYLRGDPQRGRFLAFLTGFMAAMLGLVLADNLLALFVFWELTSFTSYLLIGYKHQYEDSRASALQALLVTGGGGLALLAGVFVLAAAGGTTSISELNASGDALRQSALYVPALLLVCAGAFTKSAQTPFHFWLPNAMAAPTPVSAFLHSATMVKAGVYLLARMEPSLGGTALWTTLLVGFGTATMLTGAVMALRQTDLKKVLAYSTVTALGTLVLLLGMPGAYATRAAVVFLVVHSLYKGALFLVAGSVDHEAGTREVPALGGLRRAMPFTAAAAALAAISMAGLPPLFGFIGKELIYEAGVQVAAGWGPWVLGAAVLANALTVVAAGLVAVRPFWGAPVATPKAAHEAPWAMALGPAVLAAVSLVLGAAPFLANGLLGAAASAVAGEPTALSLKIWHGLNAALALSVVTVALGLAGYLAADRLRAGLARLDGVLARGPEAGYRAGLAGLVALAKAQTRLVQHGSLPLSLGTVFAVIVGLVGWAFVRGDVAWVPALPQAFVHEWAVAAVMLVGAVAVVVSRSRMAAVTLLGGVGFCVALLFLKLGAPDLAMTQLLVETLTVIVIVLVMRQVPDLTRSAPERAAVRARDAVLAGAVGLTMTGLVLAVLQTPLDLALAEEMAARSVPEGFGRNIVNVILVDFRALDTLGEITVLAAAAVGAFTLLRVPARERRPDAPADRAR